MPYDDLALTVNDGVARIVLQRPAVRNALRWQTYEELVDALRAVAGDDTVRALLLTGTGKGFCSGDDFSDVFGSESTEEWQQRRRLDRLRTSGLNAVVESFMAIEVPAVAAVNGAAVGMGLDLALMCDIRIASVDATFGSFFVRRGIVGTVGGTYLLPRIIGLSAAMEMLLTGDVVDARRAADLGLVSDVVPAEQLEARADELLVRLAGGPPLAQRAIKRIVRKGLEVDWRTLDEYSDAVTDVLWETEDHREGVRSFLARRAPRFVGR
ncbi:enoyl-CoA hydratase/isomerase family protein [Nocardioides sp. SYSU DS0651]|uniref:enoyl-CoA hydratase/isomerase family protein n=1 Tax=Nocardioides sp. SYSU DS0651 TaxID=3415955 RepID=UPI003F4B3EFD